MPKTLKETKENPKTHSKIDEKNPSMSLYEQSREERIKENLQRMQKLGIVDLSKKLNFVVSPKRTPKHSRSNYQRSTPVLTPGPLRRSSRLQNATPLSYSEAVLSKKYKGFEDKNVKLVEGSKPEVYTKKHGKLFVKIIGGRIYDPVNGKTCHQCRQKTLGHRTQCSKCNRLRGQFCKNCLYTRYGEHVLEAMENPNWICPVCRGICNCSLCRKAKRLPATGFLYKEISRLGFKSVAHYLFQTERAKTTLEKSPDIVNLASVKKSLSFSGSNALLKDSPMVNGNQLRIKPQFHNRKDDKVLIIEKENDMPGSSYPSTNHQTSTKRSLPFSNIEAESKNVDSTEVDLKVQNHFGFSKPQLEEETDNRCKSEEEKKLHHSGNDSNITLESCPKSQKKRAASELSPDSIASRLRQRRRKGNGCDGIQLPFVNEKSLDVNQALSNITLESCAKSQKKRAASELSPDSIASRLRQRRRKGSGCDGIQLPLVNEKSFVNQGLSNILSDKEKEMPKHMSKPGVDTELDQDSDAGRTRQ